MKVFLVVMKICMKAERMVDVPEHTLYPSHYLDSNKVEELSCFCITCNSCVSTEGLGIRVKPRL